MLFIDPDGLDDIYYDNRGNEVQRIKNEAPDRFYLANRTDRGSLEVVTQLEQAPINESPTLTSLGLASAMVIPLGGSSMSANAAIASYLEASLSIAAPTVIVVSALAIIASENKKYNLPCISGTAMEPCSPWDYDPLMDNGRLYAKSKTGVKDTGILEDMRRKKEGLDKSDQEILGEMYKEARKKWRL